MSPTIHLDINYQLDCEDDSLRYEKAAQWVARRFAWQQAEISVAIVDDQTIHQLNREHLQHDWPTDVISFVFESDIQAGLVEGEIIASHDTAARLAAAAGWSASDELLLYIVHGLLHLAGLDDLQPAQQQQMRACERDCLMALGVAGAAQYLSRFDDVSY